MELLWLCNKTLCCWCKKCMSEVFCSQIFTHLSIEWWPNSQLPRVHKRVTIHHSEPLFCTLCHIYHQGWLIILSLEAQESVCERNKGRMQFHKQWFSVASLHCQLCSMYLPSHIVQIILLLNSWELLKPKQEFIYNFNSKSIMEQDYFSLKKGRLWKL